jgi:uncharacterized membrane protein
MTFLSIGVGGYALFHVATGFAYLPPEVAGNAFPSSIGLRAHVAASGVALILGPFQFLRSLRAKRPRLHRWTGRCYVAACLTGGAAGGAIALFTTAGPVAGWGFLGLAAAWLACTGMAWTAALRRDFASHERWMIRSFALTLAAVTLRLYLPIGASLAGGFYPAYVVIAWACWVPNIVVAEIWIRSRLVRPKPTAGAVAS